MRHHMPAELWSHLPSWFLDAAVLDNYETERLFLQHFREQFEHTFVSTVANPMQPVACYSEHPTVIRLHSEMHPVLFDIFNHSIIYLF